MCPTPPHPRALALGQAPITWGGGVGIMGMWEFGGICELLFKLLFKLPKVGVGAFLFAPSIAEKCCECQIMNLAFSELAGGKFETALPD